MNNANVLDGNAVFKREDSLLMVDIGFTVDKDTGISYAANHTEEWFAIGEDNEELTRERNDSVEANKNVLGTTNINHTGGAQTTEIDPKKIRGNEKLSYALYMIDKYNLLGDRAKIRGMEVFYGDKQAEKTYGAFTEDAIISVSSWGGDTSATQAPFTLNWCGNRTHGTFNTGTKAFTETTEE